MARREPKARDTRERVLAAALAEFAARGLHAASIEDIAARAELTKGAVYYYFADKDDLAGDLQAELWQRLGRQARADLDPRAGALDQLKQAFRSFLGALDDEAEARFFLRDCWASPALDPAGRRTHEAGVDMVRALLERGIASGELAAELDADAAARVLLGAFAEATLHILTSGQIDPTMDVVARLVDALGAGDRSRRPRTVAAR
jgi:TetR/AcrR family acrAB operon transcriptional repressor